MEKFPHCKDRGQIGRPNNLTKWSILDNPPLSLKTSPFDVGTVAKGLPHNVGWDHEGVVIFLRLPK